MKASRIAAAVLFLCAAGARADDLTTVENQIRAAWEGVASLRAKIAVDAAIPVGENRMRLLGEGTVEYLKDGGAGKYRQDVRVELPEPQGVEMVSTIVFDGKDLHLATTIAGQTSRTQADDGVDPFSPPPGGGPLLDAVRRVADLALESSTTFAGRAAHVLVGTPRGGAPGAEAITRIVLTIDAETGARLKAEYFEAENVLTVSATLSDLEVGAPVDAARLTAEAAGGAPGGN